MLIELLLGVFFFLQPKLIFRATNNRVQGMDSSASDIAPKPPQEVQPPGRGAGGRTPAGVPEDSQQQEAPGA